MGNDSDWRFEPAKESRGMFVCSLVFTFGEVSEDSPSPSDLSPLLGNDLESKALDLFDFALEMLTTFGGMIKNKSIVCPGYGFQCDESLGVYQSGL